MANARGKKIDNTHLSIDTAEERRLIHRDYIAHTMRWSHVARHLHHGQLYKRAHILDIGCGREVPLARLLYSNRLIPVSGSYTGVDYNKKLEMPEMLKQAKFKMYLVPGMEFPKGFKPMKQTGGYDVITCFEVAEHVEPAGTLAILEGIRDNLSKDGVAFLSTPCYDPQTGAADNHVNEMSYQGFGALIQYAGLYVNNVFGTFASIKDYKSLLDDPNNERYGDLRKAFERLREYYDTNYLATILAPLFPAQSRNCMWQVSLTKTEDDWVYPTISNLSDQQHSSSAEWPAFIQGLTKPVTKKGRK